MLEDAAGLLAAFGKEAGGDALGPHYEQFTGLDLALISRADEIECARLGRDNKSVILPSRRLDSAEGQWTEAAGIARGKDAVTRHDHQRERAFEPAKCVGNGVHQGDLLGLRDEMDHYFGIAGGLENGAGLLQPRANVIGVDQIAVV